MELIKLLLMGALGAVIFLVVAAIVALVMILGSLIMMICSAVSGVSAALGTIVFGAMVYVIGEAYFETPKKKDRTLKPGETVCGLTTQQIHALKYQYENRTGKSPEDIIV